MVLVLYQQLSGQEGDTNGNTKEIEKIIKAGNVTVIGNFTVLQGWQRSHQGVVPIYDSNT